jgi:sec-independent protein translocase protein TatA
MMTPIFLWALGARELIIILVVVILLFGGKKIPELIKGIGRGIREFRDEKNAKKDEPETNNKL